MVVWSIASDEKLFEMEQPLNGPAMVVSWVSLCKKESQVKSEKMAFSQEESTKSQRKSKDIDFLLTFLDKSFFFDFT